MLTKIGSKDQIGTLCAGLRDDAANLKELATDLGALKGTLEQKAVTYFNNVIESELPLELCTFMTKFVAQRSSQLPKRMLRKIEYLPTAFADSTTTNQYDDATLFFKYIAKKPEYLAGKEPIAEQIPQAFERFGNSLKRLLGYDGEARTQLAQVFITRAIRFNHDWDSMLTYLRTEYRRLRKKEPQKAREVQELMAHSRLIRRIESREQLDLEVLYKAYLK